MARSSVLLDSDALTGRPSCPSSRQCHRFPPIWSARVSVKWSRIISLQWQLSRKKSKKFQWFFKKIEVFFKMNGLLKSITNKRRIIYNDFYFSLTEYWSVCECLWRRWESKSNSLFSVVASTGFSSPSRLRSLCRVYYLRMRVVPLSRYSRVFYIE